MLNGSIYGWENGDDDIFDLHSPRNRDNCLEPMRLMNVMGRQSGISLHTADVSERNHIIPDFSLYVESIDFVASPAKRNYLILYETPLTVPRNASYHYLNQFDFIFTWYKKLLNNGLKDDKAGFIPPNRFIEIHHPNPVPVESRPDFLSPKFNQRKDLVCLIGSNRHANILDERELYSERVKAIKWFEAHALNDFKLYGNGWNVPQKRFGHLGKTRYRMEKVAPWLLGKPVFPSYQGPAKTKYEVLSKTKFCICFENARDIHGYITEKIFDCLFAGCIPVYLGDAEISKSIPEACYIDFRKFSTYQDLYHYLKTIKSEQFTYHQEAARSFLTSELFIPYTCENFADTVLNKIHTDFEGERV